MSQVSYQVMMVAGEASGDQRAADCMTSWSKDFDIHFFGMGGHCMSAAGCHLIEQINADSAFGFTEVIPRIYGLLKQLRRLKKILKEKRPNCLVCVDFQAFNLKLATFAQSIGIPVLFYVGPQIWASRPGRIHRYVKAIDHLAVLYPFEPSLYQDHAIKVSYVGHPVVSKMQQVPPICDVRSSLGVDPNALVLGVFPGSRSNEVKRILPEMLGAVRRLQNQMGDLVVLVSEAEYFPEGHLDNLCVGIDGIQVHRGQSHVLMQACDVLLMTSGTATLEAALLNKPMVVTYKVHALSAWLLSKIMITPYVALCNVLLKEQVVPELLQDLCCANALSKALTPLLKDKNARDKMRQRLTQVNELLGPQGNPISMSAVLADVLSQ